MGPEKSLKFNVAINLVRQVLRIAFPIITFPYISRVLGTDSYGKFVFSNSITSYFLLLSGFGISSFAIRDGSLIKNDKKKIEEFSNSILGFNIITTVCSYLLLFLLILLSNKIYTYRIIILILSLSLILNTIGVEWLYTIYEDFVYITVRSLIFQIISLLCLFLFIKKPEDCYIYAVLSVASQAGANILNLIHSKKYLRLRPKFSFKMISQFFYPCLVFFVSSVTVTIYVNSDSTFIGLFRNTEEVGIYAVATNIYNIAKQLIYSAGTVALPRVTSYLGENKEDEYKKCVNHIFDYTMVFLIPSIVGLFFMGRNIVLIISGVDYVQAFIPLSILAVALFPAVTANLCTSILLIPHKRENLILISSVVGAGVNILLNLILIPQFGFIAAAVTTTIAELVVMTIILWNSYKYIPLFDNKRNWTSIICGCIGIYFTISIIKEMNLGVWIETLFGVIASIFVYFFMLFIMKNELIRDNMSLIMKKKGRTDEKNNHFFT